jgi:hypothetical protein
MTSLQAVRTKLHEMSLQLQILELQKGWHYTKGSQLKREYTALKKQYEKIMDYSNPG